MSLNTRKIFVSRDVRFFESVYPFCSIPGSPIKSIESNAFTDSFSSDPNITNDFSITTDPNTSPFAPSDSILESVPSSNLSPDLTYFTSDFNPISHSPSHVPHISSPTSHNSTPIPLIRSETEHNKSAYLNDYVCNVVFLTDVTNSCFNQRLFL